MTIHEKIKDLSASLKKQLSELKEESKKLTEEMTSSASVDITSKADFLRVNQNAIQNTIKLTILGVEIYECADKIRILKWLKSKDSMSKQNPGQCP